MNAVEVEKLSQRFGRTEALIDVTLSVPLGGVYGLLGLNGAGKTTLLRHLLGLHRPATGRVEVLGGDPIVDRERVMRQVGYLSEEDSLPVWMRVGDVMSFGRSVYPTWDQRYAIELCDWFELSPSTKLKSLSKGGRARAGLIAAIAHRPSLLILDEPSSGLDPIARDDILQAIIRTVSEDGRTVIFSSHLLDEVARVCDTVAVLHAGRLRTTMPLEDLTLRFAEWILRPLDSATDTTKCPLSSAIDWRGDGGEWSAVLPLNADSETTPDPPPGWSRMEVRAITLPRLFAALVGKGHVDRSDRADELAGVPR